MTSRSAGVYIHIPFCISKCSYCDFYSLPIDAALKKAYIAALTNEITALSYPGIIKTIYIGGGTPSLLAASEIELILNTLQKQFSIVENPEITMEVNPGSAGAEKIQDLKLSGINRLSIGVQSINSSDLELLGRVHGSDGAINVIRSAERYFDNYSIDLIYGIPGQSTSSFSKTLSAVVEYRPPHISAYELSIEEGRPLASMIAEGKVTPLSDDEKISLYYCLTDALMHKGYTHYEISNYSLEGCQCLHNMNYWMRGEYLGFGASAHSLINERRSRNISEITSYIRMIEIGDSAMVEEAVLNDEERVEEEIFLGLRTSSGIDGRLFSFDPEVVCSLQDAGFITEEGSRISLTEKGMLVSNRVIIELIDSLS